MFVKNAAGNYRSLQGVGVAGVVRITRAPGVDERGGEYWAIELQSAEVDGWSDRVGPEYTDEQKAREALRRLVDSEGETGVVELDGDEQD